MTEENTKCHGFQRRFFSHNGDVIASNVDMLINFSRQGGLQNWDGNFDLSPTPQFNPNSVNRTATYKVKLNDGRTGEIRLRNYTISTRTGKWNIQFNGDGALD